MVHWVCVGPLLSSLCIAYTFVLECFDHRAVVLMNFAPEHDQSVLLFEMFVLPPPPTSSNISIVMDALIILELYFHIYSATLQIKQYMKT